VNEKRIKLVCLLVLVAGSIGSGGRIDITDIVVRGNGLYETGQYDEALREYEQMDLEQADDAVLLYNRANCYYKLEDFSEASSLYSKVSTRSKDMDLVARAKYNLGNCHFQRGLKQVDSDLRKALDELTMSVGYYREVRDMDPGDEDAAHNIAVARLVIKDLLDRLKKEQEKQQQEQQQNELAKKIAELLRRQIELGQTTAQTWQKMADPNEPTPAERQQMAEQAEQQKTLQDDSVAVKDEAAQMLDQMKMQASMDPNSAAEMQEALRIMETVAEEMNNAVEQQRLAAEHLNNSQAEAGLEDEAGAAESLLKALEAFPKQEEQQQQQQQGDQEQQQQQNEQQQEQDQQQYQAPDTSARDILNKEKERRDQRQQRGRGRINPVIKDW